MSTTDLLEAERTYRGLHDKYASGELSLDRFQDKVLGLRVQDDAGYWWQIQSYDGSWARWDGSKWIPGDPFQKPDQSPEKSTHKDQGLATVKFVRTLASGMKKGITRSIPLMLVSMAAVWGIHTLLTLMVKKDALAGTPHPLIASILILPGHESAGLLFWGLLVGLVISFINKVRHDQLPATKEKLKTTPGFVRQSFDQTGFQGMLLFLLGICLALLISGLIANILVSLQCILLFVNTLIAQRESMMALFLQAIGSDISKGLHFTGNPGNSSAWLSAAGMTGGIGGFLVSLVASPSQFIFMIIFAICVIIGIFIILQYFTKKNRNLAVGG
ncbi:MAG: hypothetical protein A4E42_02175 [Methanoregulaceae archaeon PtaU1.Bin222]|nr:MAG: hypothetical protein A4E42_02175 [Methanoregulaceae archaeon PtaU1.Bin222]